MTIDSYLNELADTSRPLKTGRLANLSGLDGDERSRLAAAWPGLPVERRRAVLERLTSLAEDNPELDFDAVFMNALGDADAAVRQLAVEGLWEHTDRDIIPSLVELLRRDPAEPVRCAAALALGRFVLMGEYGDLRPRDLVTVTDALRDAVADVHESAHVRGRALEAVGASSQPWARQLIQAAYDSGDDRLAVSAVHAMGRSADSVWVPALLAELQSADPQMRYEAAGALGEIEDEEAVPYLAELLDDEDVEVQEAAIQALGQIGGADARSILRGRANDPDERVREAVQAALDQAEFGDDPLGLRL
jgi:HEAT repeat protein